MSKKTFIDIRVPMFEVGLFGIRAFREDGFLYVRFHLLTFASFNNDQMRSLLEYWYDEEAAANYPNESAHHELHIFWTRWKVKFSQKKKQRLVSNLSTDSTDV